MKRLLCFIFIASGSLHGCQEVSGPDGWLGDVSADRVIVRSASDPVEVPLVVRNMVPGYSLSRLSVACGCDTAFIGALPPEGSDTVCLRCYAKPVGFRVECSVVGRMDSIARLSGTVPWFGGDTACLDVTPDALGLKAIGFGARIEDFQDGGSAESDI